MTVIGRQISDIHPAQGVPKGEGAEAEPLADKAPATALQPAAVPDEQFIDLPAAIRRHAAENPGAPALVAEDQVLDWAGFGDRVARTARLLEGQGVRPGDVVASLAGTSPDHVVVYMASLWLGACMAPLPLGAHPDALAGMANDCGAGVILADAEQVPLASGLSIATVIDLSTLDKALATLAPLPPRTASPGDAFDIIYSSGTTGTPKGIQHDHRFRSRQNIRLKGYGLGRDSVALVSTPVYSNTTLALLLPMIAHGGRMVLMRKFNEERFLELCEAHRVTHMMLVPVQYRRLLAHPRFDAFDLTSCQVKLSTSAPLTPDLVRDALARWPGRLVNIYGMTEGGVSAILDCGAFPDKLHTVGRAINGAVIRILDAEGNALPPGEVGEVVGHSPTIMTGYRNAPDKTREASWRSPDGLDFIRSGDMGKLDEDGFLVLLDRSKDMIISGGFNIYAVDLERVLLEHPDVVDCAVIGIPSARWGETPLGLVVARPDSGVTPKQICEWANARLGKIQRLSAVELRAELPRSSIGKVLKRELRAPYLAAAPE
ncbi:acyl-CoA synthetase (AMP-forming)/AMP-acid ligase II [Brevirhabdus pacifica]|uniref:class I adenylate-forming enzyme family protein n=1 Tax=Brevirhabdus pacifica TaxID=1267768 RepID=UPI000CB5D32A|nr:class I adenylate-forming enzyme family protein [Brevirhabdus pacifica]PJJ87327.1 acyl-CoA synthetase (AMP-forming)/AMP-acid ligase II [Brevirhabdus pacifica]